MKTPSIAVWYYDWKHAGPEARDRFIASYDKHPAGLDHELFMPRHDTGWIDAHFLHAVETTIKHEYICFLTAYVEILGDNWLALLLEAASDPAIGVAGASGSWGQGVGRQFPNPHIRTSAYVIERNLLLSMTLTSPRTKEECYEIESGTSGITRQAIARGLSPVVVGRDGKRYRMHEWPRSGIFWQGDQSNLLIGDNRTREYDEADEGGKMVLREFAWGKR